MIAELWMKHEDARKLGYSIEQVIPYQKKEQMMADLMRDADSGAFTDLMYVDSSEAFRDMPFTTIDRSTVVYARYTRKETEKRKNLVHEIHIPVRNRKTRRTGFLDAAKI